MKTFINTIRIGWDYLTHPYLITDKLINDKKSFMYSWIFLIFSLVLWTFITGYQNLVVGDTSRAREVKLGISMGPDIIITLLTIPIGILVILGISFLVSKILKFFGANSNFRDIFCILAFTLNIGSTFIDMQYEIGATLTGHAWMLHEVPNFFYYTAFIMLAPILWSLIITILSLSYYSKLGIWKTLLAFFIGVFPLFALLIFVVM